MKFTPNFGKIELSINQSENTLKLSVKDNGRGIHAEDLPFVFDRFFQTKKEDAPAEGGTGIGLALVKEYANLFNGNVWVESEFDKGSEFFFEWPFKKIALTPDAVIPQKDLTQKENSLQVLPNSNDIMPTYRFNGKKPTIMVVEDNPEMRAFIKLILEELYNVICKENGQEAFNFLKKELLSPESKKIKNSSKIDLIISDVMMPVMDGFQLIQKLKGNKSLSNIPVVMLTARADIHDKLKALRIGVDDYILKPFLEEEVLVRIKNILDRQMRKESFRKEENFDTNYADSYPESVLTSNEWLIQLENLVSAEVQNDLLTVSWLAEKLGMSERHLLRQVKTLTGLNPNQYIREFRLQEGRKLLESGRFKTLKDIAWKVSFRDQNYFSKIYLERFGKRPSEYM